MADMTTTGGAARALGVTEATIQHLLRRHPELAPTGRLAGRRVWTATDIEKVRAWRAGRDEQRQSKGKARSA